MPVQTNASLGTVGAVRLAEICPPSARACSCSRASMMLSAKGPPGLRVALEHPDRDPTRRELLAAKQQPYGVVLSCIDSRVPPELVFDTGLGDLYVMRTGGLAVGRPAAGRLRR